MSILKLLIGQNEQENNEKLHIHPRNLTSHLSPFKMSKDEQHDVGKTEGPLDYGFSHSNYPDDNNSDDTFFPRNEYYFAEDGTMFNFSNYDFSDEYFVRSGDTVSENDSVTFVPQDIPISNGRIVALALFTMFFLVGIVGNALVIGTTAKFGSMRKVVTYLYLVNLSVANLLFLLVCLPTSTASYALVKWPFGQTFCQVEKYIMSISMSASVLTIVATGLDRYLAIVYPVKSKTYRTTRNTLIILGLIWVLSLTLMIPRMQLFSVSSFFNVVDETDLCVRVASTSTLKIDTTLTCLFLYVLPLVVLVICHVRIGQTIWRRGRNNTRDGRPYQGGLYGIRERRRIAKIVIAITIVFGIGWLPIHLYNLVEDFDYGNILFGEVLERGSVALFFSFGANALNPLIYCVISSTYRKHIINTLLCRKTSMLLRTARERRAEESSYRRTAPILQPRPALILPSPPRIQTELSRHLLEPHSSETFVTTTSPVSVEELAGIRVSDIDQISTSSLMKNVLVSSPSYLKKETDMTSSVLKTTSPSLILTDLEISAEQDKENIDTASHSPNTVFKSSDNDTCTEYIDMTLYSTKAKDIDTEGDLDNRYHSKICEKCCTNNYEKTTKESHVHKLPLTSTHNKSQISSQPFQSPHKKVPFSTSLYSSLSSTSSPKFHTQIESHQSNSLVTSEANKIQSRLALQAQILSSNLQPRKHRLINIKSFSSTNNSENDTEANNPLCYHPQHNKKNIHVLNPEQSKFSKIVLLPNYSSLHPRQSSDIREEVQYQSVKDADDDENDSMILSKPKIHKQNVLQKKSTPSKQRKNSKYDTQDVL